MQYDTTYTSYRVLHTVRYMADLSTVLYACYVLPDLVGIYGTRSSIVP